MKVPSLRPNPAQRPPPNTITLGVRISTYVFGGDIQTVALLGASLVAQMVKNLPAMQKTWVRSVGWEDPLEEGLATQSSILAWRIPMDRGAWSATVHGIAKNQT